jgi:hypothetical protein
MSTTVTGSPPPGQVASRRRAQRLDAAAEYGPETQLEIGSGPGPAGTLWGLTRRLAEYR